MSGNGPHSRATQAERAVGAIRFFLYIRFFLNAPLDLLLDVLTLSRSLALHFTVVGGLPLNHFCASPPPLHFKIRRVPPTLVMGREVRGAGRGVEGWG